MTSHILSRFGTSGRGGRSFYEELRDADDDDFADRDRMDLDEANLRENLDGIDVERAESLLGPDSQANLGLGLPSSPSSHGPPSRLRRPASPKSAPALAEARASRRWPQGLDDPDDDVPASLLVEPNDGDPRGAGEERPKKLRPPRATVVPGSATARSRAQWETAQSHQRLHNEDFFQANPRPIAAGAPAGSARERALWHWVNTSNLDRFVKDIYDYYEGCGMWCILCDRALRLLETTFVAALLTFLTQCVDFAKIPKSHALHEVVIPQCTTKMSTFWNLGIWCYVFYFIWKCVQFTVDLRRLHRIRSFYTHLLRIPEQDMQTVSWQDIVARIMSHRDENPKTATNVPPRLRRFIGSQSKERLDAHDIANRLMRQDNYLIALINKDVLDLSLPIPLLRGRQFFSKTLEWCLQFSVLDFVFNDVGQVRQEFLKAERRGILSQKLKQRFIFAGLLNLVFAPFLVAYILVVYIFTYYQEYQKDPSILGARRYTSLAEWKFREFNELPHIFRERINMSYPFATRYITQFPKQMTEQFARTVAFITGALAAVLAAVSVLDTEIFINFEITQDRTVLFYFTVLGTIWAFARNSVSEETAVFNPEYALRNVIDYTRYLPDHWQGRLHSAEVKREFSDLYKLKWVVVLEEMMGIVTAPCLLLLSLPKCSDQIVDFFREFTIHVDGLGYVCSFAVFDFKKGVGEHGQHTVPDVRDDFYSTKHGKMAASFYGFLDNYVINPKTGIPGHMPPGTRQQFYPPPAFPGLNSPTLAADMQGSRVVRDRPRSRAPAAGQPGGQPTPRFGPSVPQPSPMASMLLDPHHQPSAAANMNARSLYRARQARYPGDDVIEESSEYGTDRRRLHEYEDSFEGGGVLGESVWETSPAKALSRENSGAIGEESETGVLGLIYQLQQTQRPQRNRVL